MDSQKHEDQNVGQLKAEIEKRNADRTGEDKIAADGAKADLVAALQLDDERVAGLAAPDAVAPTQAGVTDEGDAKEVVQELVTLVHPEHEAEVQVFKPSRDYTNYVRGYGYQEAK